MYKKNPMPTQLQLRLSHMRHCAEVLFLVKWYKPFCKLLWSSDLFWPWKELYQKLVVGNTFDPLIKLAGWLLLLNWAQVAGFLKKSDFLLTDWLAWNALLLHKLALRVDLAYMPDCHSYGRGMENTPLKIDYDYLNL